LKDLLALFDQDLKLALAAYNAGENVVIRYGRRIPPFQRRIVGKRGACDERVERSYCFAAAFERMSEFRCAAACGGIKRQHVDNDETRERLDKLAQATQRTRSFLAAEALREYLDLQEWQVKEIEAGVGEADKGDLIAHEDVMNKLDEKLAGLLDQSR
jgi:RHH-type rel operon transcriptional repressor/antitoxin RelB